MDHPLQIGEALADWLGRIQLQDGRGPGMGPAPAIDAPQNAE